MCAAGIFIYQTLDAIDGKQARRTNSASPLGELFDHGCDSLSTGMILLNHIPQSNRFLYFQLMFPKYLLPWLHALPLDSVRIRGGCSSSVSPVSLFFTAHTGRHTCQVKSSLASISNDPLNNSFLVQCAGTLRFGKIDVTEAQYGIIGLHLLTFIFGSSMWQQRVSIYLRIFSNLSICLKNRRRTSKLEWARNWFRIWGIFDFNRRVS